MESDPVVVVIPIVLDDRLGRVGMVGSGAIEGHRLQRRDFLGATSHGDRRRFRQALGHDQQAEGRRGRTLTNANGPGPVNAIGAVIDLVVHKITVVLVLPVDRSQGIAPGRYGQIGDAGVLQTLLHGIHGVVVADIAVIPARITPVVADIVDRIGQCSAANTGIFHLDDPGAGLGHVVPLSPPCVAEGTIPGVLAVAGPDLHQALDPTGW